MRTTLPRKTGGAGRLAAPRIASNASRNPGCGRLADSAARRQHRCERNDVRRPTGDRPRWVAYGFAGRCRCRPKPDATASGRTQTANGSPRDHPPQAG
ncbi:hypothetical protein FCJ61_12605 [Burkholderia metallica]|nr:hypothetical protein [Burkholderia metallica]